MSGIMKSFSILLLTICSLAVHAEPESHFFNTSDGVRLHYITDGTSGTPVVLIHGFTSSAQSNWYNPGVAQELAKRHRVIAIDMRNHGQSQVVNERQPGIVRDVLELLDHLELDKVHMHGYSMGGFTTFAVLAYAPERLITASGGGSGVIDLPENVDPAAEFDWTAALTDPVPTRYPIDLTAVTIPVMAINGSSDAPFPKTVRMTRELKNFTNFVLPGYNHMNALTGTGYAERLAFFLSENDPQ
ncbi:MAG: alpha/beta hydrolase [Pseudomonadota bacterium]